ncbi:MAG: hypothetical protein ACI4D3_09870 [Lachnospiraceae bacterium]
MHALFRYAMLPQIKDAEKMQYLNQALELASRLEKETGDVEYMIAVGCIGEEMDQLHKNLQKQMAADRRQIHMSQDRMTMEQKQMEADQEQAMIF